MKLLLSLEKPDNSFKFTQAFMCNYIKLTIVIIALTK